jgi:hypothetical protein
LLVFVVVIVVQLSNLITQGLDVSLSPHLVGIVMLWMPVVWTKSGGDWLTRHSRVITRALGVPHVKHVWMVIHQVGALRSGYHMTG